MEWKQPSEQRYSLVDNSLKSYLKSTKESNGHTTVRKSLMAALRSYKDPKLIRRAFFKYIERNLKPRDTGRNKNQTQMKIMHCKHLIDKLRPDVGWTDKAAHEQIF